MDQKTISFISQFFISISNTRSELIRLTPRSKVKSLSQNREDRTSIILIDEERVITILKSRRGNIKRFTFSGARESRRTPPTPRVAHEYVIVSESGKAWMQQDGHDTFRNPPLPKFVPKYIRFRYIFQCWLFRQRFQEFLAFRGKIRFSFDNSNAIIFDCVDRMTQSY